VKALRIVLFVKAPLAGFAKTRLIPKLGEQGAADLAATLFQHALNQAVLANIGSVELCVTPDAQHPIWSSFSIPDGIHWTEQGDGDLGERLSRAAQRVTDGGETVLLMGTDCPALDSACLKNVAQSLRDNDVCMVPVSDGGYALLGLNQYQHAVFSGIPWSTDKVAMLTKQKIAAMNWRFAALKELNDIDEPEDLKYLPDGFC